MSKFIYTLPSLLQSLLKSSLQTSVQCTLFGLFLISPIVTQAEPIYKIVAPALQGTEFLHVIEQYLDQNLAKTSSIAPSIAKQPNNKKAILSNESSKNSILRITVGQAGLAQALSSATSEPILATFISRYSFENAIKSLTDHQKDSIQITAVFSDPDPQLQIKLIKAIYGPDVIIAYLSSEMNSELIELESAGVKTALVENSRDIGQQLNLLSPFDVLLASPDRLIYNQNTLHNLIRSLYRQDRVLVGYSNAFVKAGALASLYSSQTQILAEVTARAQAYHISGILAPPSYTYHFDIGYNQHLAKSFGLLLPDRQRTLNHLEAQQVVSQ